MARRKLNEDDRVEVRQFEEGLRGSWHRGVVVRAVKRKRVVRYDHLLFEDTSNNLEEDIKASHAIEGWEKWANKRRTRGFIRPVPPHVEKTSQNWTYGLCVDAFYEDAWWEGILFDDNEDADERRVFFPDEGDEGKFKAENLRISQEWDERDGTWKIRGHWFLADEMQRSYLKKGYSLRSFWYYMRQNDGFLTRIREWTLGAEALWGKIMTNVFKHTKKKKLLSGSVASTGASSKGEKLLTLGEGNAAAIPESNSEKQGGLIEAVPEKQKVNKEAKSSSGKAAGESFVVKAPKRRRRAKVVTDLQSTMQESNPSNTPDRGKGNKSNNEKKVDDNSLVKKARRKKNKEKKEECDWLLKELSTKESNEKDKDYVQSMPTEGSETLQDAVVNTDQNLQCVAEVPSSSLPSIKEQGRECSNNIENNGESATNLDRAAGNMDVMVTEGLDMQKNSKVANGENSSCAVPVVNDSLPLYIHKKQTSNRKNPKLDGLSTTCWDAPAGGLPFDSEYCPSALNYNANMEKSVKNEFRIKAKMHLLSLGWKLEFKRRKGSYDTRYLSPNGHSYYSLVSACLALKEQEKKINESREENNDTAQTNGGINMFLLSPDCIKKPRRRKKSSNMEGEMPGTTQSHGNGGIGLLLGNSKTLDKQKRGRKPAHTVKMEPGAESQSLIKEDMDMLFRSKAKRGRKRNKGVLMDDNSGNYQAQEDNSGIIQANGSRKRNRSLGKESNEGKKAKQGRWSLSNRKAKSSTNCRMRVRFSPKDKAKASNNHRSIRSVLSLLLENGLVKENQTVFYKNNKEAPQQAEGRITHEGILCSCCQKVHTLSAFEAHAGSELHRPSENTMLEDGTSLLECQMRLLEMAKNASRTRKDELPVKVDNDQICNVCSMGGRLILCDRCPASFHSRCLDLKGVPEGDWYCKRCQCSVCHESKFNKDQKSFTKPVMTCDQCECMVHAECFSKKAGNTSGYTSSDYSSSGNWFCTKECSEIFLKLRSLVGVVHDIGDGYSFTILRSKDEDSENPEQSNCDYATAEHHSKLCVSLNLMHECFIPMVDERIGKDVVEAMVFNRGYPINRWNFRRFYTMLLEKDDDLISVATVRVHGKRAAEIPLVGTRIEYRRKGMCRLLFNQLEKVLKLLGVEKIILPAVDDLKQTWEKGFGFHEINPIEKRDLLDLNVLCFPNIHILQKLLTDKCVKHEPVDAVTSSRVNVPMPVEDINSGVCNIKMETDDFKIEKVKLVSSCSHVPKTITPICSSQSNTYQFPSDHKGVEQDLYADSFKRSRKVDVKMGDEPEVVVLGHTRSKRLVKQVVSKVAYKFQGNVLQQTSPVQHQHTSSSILTKKRKNGIHRFEGSDINHIKDTDGGMPSATFHLNDLPFGMRIKRKRRRHLNNGLRNVMKNAVNCSINFQRNGDCLSMQNTWSSKADSCPSDLKEVRDQNEKVPETGLRVILDSNLRPSAVEEPNINGCNLSEQSLPNRAAVEEPKINGCSPSEQSLPNGVSEDLKDEQNLTKNPDYDATSKDHDKMLLVFKCENNKPVKCYYRRKKLACSANGVSEDNSSEDGLPTRHSILHFNSVC